jgi:HAD superfamily phosphatase (TIGR01681 family)
MTLERIQTSSKKVLILDCDNTLWGGIVGEDGYNGIRIGTDGEGLIFTDFQKSILRLKNEGVILCIVSKNNKEDVMEVLNKNKNMVLKLEDFSLVKANWKTKSQNIKDLSVELDLSLESFAFFDDNSLERDLVRKNLHKVHVIKDDSVVMLIYDSGALAANVDILMLPKSQFWRHVFVSSRHVGPTQKHVADIMRCRASFCVSYFVSCRQFPTCCIGALHMSWWGIDDDKDSNDSNNSNNKVWDKDKDNER